MSAGGPNSVAISRQSARYVVALGLVLLSVTVVGAALGGVTAAESQSSPVEVSDWTDLDDIRNDTDADYVLVNDLNETTAGYETVAGPNANGGKGFAPIGGFNGSFDGQGNSIANLTIDRPSENEVGLFGNTSGSAVIEEVILTGATVTGSREVGGLVGYNDFDGTVSTSSVNGAVTGSQDVGGLVGLNVGTVSNSSASGAVNGSDYVGGLVGYNGGPVSNSSASGAVNGSGFVGGLVGVSNFQGTESESFATGAVTGSSYVGGLVGRNYGNGGVTGAYWDTQATGQSQSAGGIGLTTTQMQGASAAQNMDALDFTNTWRVVTNPPGYPELRGLPDGPGPEPPLTAGFTITPENPIVGEQLTFDADPSTPESDIESYDWTLGDGTTATGKQVTHTYTDSGQFTVELTVQDGTETDTATETVSISPPSSPVEISDWTDLDDIRNNPDADYVLVNDLDETTPGYETVAGPNANGGKGFAPIGGFNGSFDGQGNRIANLTIDRPSKNEVGLFGDTSGSAVIEEVILTGATVTGSQEVGGLVGDNDGTVSNSSASGAVNGYRYVGGLVGDNDGTVSNSSATGDLTATGEFSNVGGLVGDNFGTVSNSSASGTVTGSAFSVGGLVGTNGGTVSNSSASGAVNGSSFVGGLVGRIVDDGTVSNSSASGAVNGSSTVGGLVGRNFGTVSSSSASGAVNATGSAVGGLVGDNPGTVSNSSASGVVTGSGTIGVGGLVGKNDGTVSNSSATGDVTATGEFSSVGGLVGDNFGTVSTSSASGAVNGSDYVGGLVGYNGGTVSTSSASGAVTGSDEVGGLVGRNFGTVSTSSASGAVTGSQDVGGLVGVHFDGMVSNSSASGAVTGNQWVGGLVGTNSEATVSNSSASGTVTGSGAAGHMDESSNSKSKATESGAADDSDLAGGIGANPTLNPSAVNTVANQASQQIGGLIGRSEDGSTVKNSIASGSVSGGSFLLAGLVGSNVNSDIINSTSLADIDGTREGNAEFNQSIAGLAGFNSGTIANSSATGDVTAPNLDEVAGLVGDNRGTVSESFATGAVTGSSDVGGLVGKNFGTVTGAYWDTQATGQSQSAGGIGLTTTQMQGASAAQNMDALDFTTTWRVVTNPPGYPELRGLPDGPPPSGSKTLSVTAKNATGEIVSGAELILYTEDSKIVASRQTNQSGVASWSTLTSGEYSVELYGPSGAFWGATAVTVAGDNTSATVQRTAPRLSQVTLAGDENGDGGYYGGRPVTVSPEIQNDGAERPVRVQIKLDTDNDNNLEGSPVLRGGGGTSIPTGEIGYYGYEFDPKTNGTKQVRVVTETKINNDWIVTDDSGWIKNFEIEHNIIGFKPLGSGKGVTYSNSTTDSSPNGVQAGAALLPEGTSLPNIELPGTDYETKNTSMLNESYPWSAVGRIVTSVDGESICSGAIIEDNHVITAAHCVHNGTPAEFSFFNPGAINTTDFLRTITVEFVQTYKKWANSGNTTYDIAVLTLDESQSSKLGVSSETGTFGYEAHSKESPVYGSPWNPFGKEPAHLTGYPNVQNASFVDRQGDQWDMIVQGEGTNVAGKNSACRDTHLCHDYASRGLFSQDTFGGQSGGPVWQLLPNKPTIISIHSGFRGYFIGNFRFTDSVGVRITEKKHNDINEMIAHGYEQPHIDEPRPGVETPNSPPDGSSGSATGDPHLTTYDGVAYDFQAVGEFVLTNGSDNTPQVQARLRPIDTGAVSVISAVATQINGTPLTIDARDQQALTVNGTSQSIEPGESVSVENGEIIRTSEKYIVVYPGADGVVDDGDSRLEVTLSGDRLDAAISLNRTAVDSVSGLLGSPDGNASNDLVLANGTVLSSSPSFETLYGQYRDDYRVTAETSLFDYEDGESASGFFDPTYPSQRVTVDGLSNTTREQAIDAASAAGLEPGTAQFRDAVIDYALTGTQSYLDSASRAARQTSSSVDATPSETSLTAPGLSVTVESSRVISSNQSLNVSVAASHPDPGNVTVVISNSTEIVYEQNVTGAFNSEQTISWNTRVDGNGSLASAGNYTLSVIATTQAGVENITTSGFTLESSTNQPATLFNVTITDTTEPVEGQDLAVTTQITNTGAANGTQSVTLDAGGLGANSTTVTLADGATTTEVLTIATESGDAGTYTAQVATENDTASTGVRVDAPATFDVTLTSVDNEVTAGDTIDATYEVTNTGDVQDTQALDFAVNGTTEDTEAGVTLNGSETFSGQFSYTTGSVDTPAVSVAVASEDDSASETVTVNDPAVFDVTITSADSAVTAGEMITASYEVTNTGDVQDTQDINFSINGSVEDTEPSVTLNESETVSGQFSYTTGSADTPAVSVAVVSEDDSASETVTVNAPAAFDVAITSVDSAVTAGELITASYEVTNTGDVQATQDINFSINGTVNDTEAGVTLNGSETFSGQFSYMTESADTPAVSVAVASEDDSASETVTVNNPAVFDVTITSVNSAVTAGETITAFYKLTNTGDVQATQDIEFSINGTTEDTEAGVALNGSETFSGQFTYTTGTADTPAVSVAVASEDDSAGETVTVNDPAVFDVAITSVDSAVTAGERVTASYEVTNTGDVQATQDINFKINRTVNDTESGVTLNGSETFSGQFTYTTGSADTPTVDVTVVSNDDSASETVTVNDPAVFNVAITSVDSAVTAGEIVTASYEVTNTGDVQATQDIEFTVNGTTEDTESGVTLNGSETFSGQFSYRTESADTPAVSVAVSSADDSETETVTMNEPASFDVTITSVDSAVTEGETITVSYELQNTGDVTDTQEITFAVNGTAEDTASGVTLDGSETFSGQFSYDTVAGDTPAVSVTVSSADDSASATVTVNEPANFDVTITSVDSAVTEGETIMLAYEVSNTGDVQATQDIEFSVNGSVEDTEAGVTLNGSETVSGQFSYTTGSSDTPAVTIAVASEDDAASETVTVNAPATFDVTLTSVNSTVTAGEMITASYEVTNTGDRQATQDIEFTVNGTVKGTESGVTLNGTETFSGQFSYSTSDADTPVVSVTVSSKDTTASADVIVRVASELVVNNLTTPAAVTVGDSLNFTATVSNPGTSSITQQFNLTVNGTTVDTTTVSLDGGNATTVQLTWQTGAGDDGNATVRLSDGDAAATTNITVDPLTVADYADKNGIVTTLGLFDAIEDWRQDLIETQLLLDVIAAWRSDKPV